MLIAEGAPLSSLHFITGLSGGDALLWWCFLSPAGVGVGFKVCPRQQCYVAAERILKTPWDHFHLSSSLTSSCSKIFSLMLLPVKSAKKSGKNQRLENKGICFCLPLHKINSPEMLRTWTVGEYLRPVVFPPAALPLKTHKTLSVYIPLRMNMYASYKQPFFF